MNKLLVYGLAGLCFVTGILGVLFTGYIWWADSVWMGDSITYLRWLHLSGRLLSLSVRSVMIVVDTQRKW